MHEQLRRLNALYILDGLSTDLIYGPKERLEIDRLVDVFAPPQTRDSIQENLTLLADVEVILSGWGGPIMDHAFLSAAPNLKAVFHGAGSIRVFTPEPFWERDIAITSAYEANAVPVAEYTLSVILLSLKHFWRYAHGAKANQGWGDHTRPVTGCFDSTVGLISCGAVARRLLEMLRPFDLHRMVYCPFLSQREAAELGVELVSLPDLFRRADVVSIHTPLLPETTGLITGRHVASMRPNATLINTSRGPIVREPELIDVLRERPDLTAVLDVTDPEPPLDGSPFSELPNIVLTPHIAGSMGPEIRRLGRCMVEELRRFVAGEPLKWRITKEAAAKMA